MNDGLPIEPHIPDIIAALGTHGKAVVVAEPGAGKTTRIPLALLEHCSFSGKNIVMLEPRRLAARMAAARMADLLGEPVGETVGYQIRNERVIGSRTRIHVITEGILTRRIQHDPELCDTGLVIFDEFHERNIHSDLGLALCLEISEVFRKDLNILVMSATMEAEAVSRLLADAPVIKSQGKSFPVTTLYQKRKRSDQNRGFNEKDCASVTMKALEQHQGDILVFLPGAGEIRKISSILGSTIVDPNVSIHSLYGNLDKKDQDAAIQPSKPGTRKIVLATSIAETSLTIEGVCIVIDSGFMRVPRYYPGYAMGRLETLPVSKASADQRRGRAGRLGPGVCYRLWAEEDHVLHPAYNTPEIYHADLTALALELALWGVRDIHDLKWLDVPPAGAYEQALNVLSMLGAIDGSGHITGHGKKLSNLGMHPRLGHMLVKAKDKGQGSLACLIAALLSERDFLVERDTKKQTDIRLRLSVLHDYLMGKKHEIKDTVIHKHLVFTIVSNAKKYEKDLGIKPSSFCVDDAGVLLSYAYPERVAMAKKGVFGSFKLATGPSVYFSDTDSLCSESMVVCADLDGQRKNSRIYLAAPYAMTNLENDFGHIIKKSETLRWDEPSKSVVSQISYSYDQLVLYSRAGSMEDKEAVSGLMIRYIREQGLQILLWTRDLKNIKARAFFLGSLGMLNDFPDLGDDALEKNLEQWLKPFLSNVRSLAHLKKMDLSTAFMSLLTWNQKKQLDTMAPTHVVVPSGSRLQLDYEPVENKLKKSPVLSVRLQEMFGCATTPRIAGGKIPLTLHLLSPAGRIMQVTQDLESFWENTYEQVKKDLKGRYPKHYWPDNPLCAMPTSRTRKKMTDSP